MGKAESRAISIAIHDAVVEYGGLESLCRILGEAEICPVFAESTKTFVYELKAASRDKEIYTRASGSVWHTMVAMCLQANIATDYLPAVVDSGGIIAPIMFYSGYIQRHMVTGDLTVYAPPR